MKFQRWYGNEQDFRKQVDALLSERVNDKISALDLGRRFRELCTEYLKTHSKLPEGFEDFG